MQRPNSITLRMTDVTMVIPTTGKSIFWFYGSQPLYMVGLVTSSMMGHLINSGLKMRSKRFGDLCGGSSFHVSQEQHALFSNSDLHHSTLLVAATVNVSSKDLKLCVLVSWLLHSALQLKLPLQFISFWCILST